MKMKFNKFVRAKKLYNMRQNRVYISFLNIPRKTSYKSVTHKFLELIEPDQCQVVFHDNKFLQCSFSIVSHANRLSTLKHAIKLFLRYRLYRKR